VGIKKHNPGCNCCGCVLGCADGDGLESSATYNEVVVSLTALPTSTTYGGWQQRTVGPSSPPYGTYFMSMTTWADFIGDYINPVFNTTACEFGTVAGTISSPAMRCTVYQESGGCATSSITAVSGGTNLTPTLSYSFAYDSEYAQILLTLAVEVTVSAGFVLQHFLEVRQAEFVNGSNPATEPDMWARCLGGDMLLTYQAFPYPDDFLDWHPTDPYDYCASYPPPLSVTGTYEFVV